MITNGKLDYSKAQVEQLMAEVQDPERVQLICGKHNYVPDLLRAPFSQCPECWQAYIFLLVASMPPHFREEFTVALQEFGHKTVENPLGFTLFDHPEIEIVKG